MLFVTCTGYVLFECSSSVMKWMTLKHHKFENHLVFTAVRDINCLESPRYFSVLLPDIKVINSLIVSSSLSLGKDFLCSCVIIWVFVRNLALFGILCNFVFCLLTCFCLTMKVLVNCCAIFVDCFWPRLWGSDFDFFSTCYNSVKFLSCNKNINLIHLNMTST